MQQRPLRQSSAIYCMSLPGLLGVFPEAILSLNRCTSCRDMLLASLKLSNVHNVACRSSRQLRDEFSLYVDRGEDHRMLTSLQHPINHDSIVIHLM